MHLLHSIPKLTRWWAIGLCTLLLSLSPSLVWADAPFYWDFITVDLTLEPNGDVVVNETQKYTFTASYSNECYRYIPLDRIDAITQVVVSENNAPLPIETGTQNKQFWIHWQHPLHPPESHTFVLSYRVKGIVQTQGDQNILSWKAIFPDRLAPVNHSKVTIHLPEALAGQIANFSSKGALSITREINPRTLEVTVDQPLLPWEYLDVNVAFDKHLLNIAQPRWQKAAQPRLTPQDVGLVAFIALLMLVGAITGLKLLARLNFAVIEDNFRRTNRQLQPHRYRDDSGCDGRHHHLHSYRNHDHNANSDSISNFWGSSGGGHSESSSSESSRWSDSDDNIGASGGGGGG